VCINNKKIMPLKDLVAWVPLGQTLRHADMKEKLELSNLVCVGSPKQVRPCTARIFFVK
jgi:hypothetical protein